MSPPLIIPPEPIPDPMNPAMAQLFDYWREKQTAGVMPALSDIALIDLYAIAPHLFMIDVLREAGRRRPDQAAAT